MTDDDARERSYLEQQVEEVNRRRREELAAWDPAQKMTAADNEYGVGYARRQRVYWGAITLALTVWVRGHPTPRLEDYDVRLALDSAADMVCIRGPTGIWPGALDAVHHALSRRRPFPPPAAAEIPQTTPAVAALLSAHLPSEPDPGWPLQIGPRYLLAEAKVHLTPHSPRQRLRLYWCALWLALSAWGENRPRWLGETLRGSARRALDRAGPAICSRWHGRLPAAESELVAVLHRARLDRAGPI